MDTFETIRTIRSVREFDLTRSVPDEIVTRILNAGRLSGSSKNTQPWEFILIRDRGTLEALSKLWEFAKHLAVAEFGIAIVMKDGKRDGYDEGRCAQNMMLAAWNDGVGSCIASIHLVDEAKRVLGIPDEYSLAHVISFGYPTAQVLERIKTPGKGGRHTLDEILHKEHWRNA